MFAQSALIDVVTLLELIRWLINGKQKRLSFPFLNKVLIHNCSLLLRFHSRLTRAYRIVGSKKIDWDNYHDLHIWRVTHLLFDNKISFYRPKAHSDLVYIFEMKTFFFFVGLWCWWEGYLRIRFGALDSCMRIFIKTVCLFLSLKRQIGMILCTLALIPLHWSHCCRTSRVSTGTSLLH